MLLLPAPLLTGDEYVPELEGIDDERVEPDEYEPLLPVLLKLSGFDLYEPIVLLLPVRAFPSVLPVLSIVETLLLLYEGLSLILGLE